MLVPTIRLLLEGGMLLWGIYTLVTGRLHISSNRIVTGWRARLVALFLVLPLPLIFAANTVTTGTTSAEGLDAALIEIIIVMVCLLFAAVIALVSPGTNTAKNDG